MLPILLALTFAAKAQEIFRIKSGGIVTIQNGAALTLRGGITLEDGSSLLNNGSLQLLDNVTAKGSDWTDSSAGGAMSGSGLVVFKSANNQNFSGKTNFYNVRVNTGGLTLHNNLPISNILNLVNGRINTNGFAVLLNNRNPAALLNDHTNAGYTKSWINGCFGRSITANTAPYDFPVGSSTVSNLLQFINNNLTGTGYLIATFDPKPGSDDGLNVAQEGAAYKSLNNGGVWYLTPDVAPTGGSYALHLYFSGFTGLADNLFGILRRPDSSSNGADWIVPPGSSLEASNGLGRKVGDRFARRVNISGFSQLGIGIFSSLPCDSCSAVILPAPSAKRIPEALSKQNATGALATDRLNVLAYPNPYEQQFSLQITTPVSSMATIEFFTMDGTRVFVVRKYVMDKMTNIVPYTGPIHAGGLIYKVTVGGTRVSGVVMGIER